MIEQTIKSETEKVQTAFKTFIKSQSETIAGFLNNNGGNLYLGVNDNGFAVGIEHDLQYLNSSTTDYYTYEPSLDHYQLKIRNLRFI